MATLEHFMLAVSIPVGYWLSVSYCYSTHNLLLNKQQRYTEGILGVPQSSSAPGVDSFGVPLRGG